MLGNQSKPLPKLLNESSFLTHTVSHTKTHFVCQLQYSFPFLCNPSFLGPHRPARPMKEPQHMASRNPHWPWVCRPPAPGGLWPLQKCCWVRGVVCIEQTHRETQCPLSPLHPAQQPGHLVVCGEALEKPLFFPCVRLIECAQNQTTYPWSHWPFSRRCCCYPKEPKLLSKGWSGWGPLALLQQLSSKSSCLIHRRLYRPSPKFRFKFTHHFRQVQTSLTPLYPSGDPSSIQDRALVNAAATATLLSAARGSRLKHWGKDCSVPTREVNWHQIIFQQFFPLLNICHIAFYIPISKRTGALRERNKINWNQELY